MSANGLYVFTLQASFVLGFAVLGPLFQRVVGHGAAHRDRGRHVPAGGRDVLDPAAGPTGGGGGAGLHRGASEPSAPRSASCGRGSATSGAIAASSGRSCYLAITASLIGVLGVLGPDFAVKVLGLSEADFVVIVLPLGAGLVVGILTLNVVRQVRAAPAPHRGRPDRDLHLADHPAGWRSA